MKRKHEFEVMKQLVLNIIVILLPFIAVGFVLILNGYKLRFSMLIPVWNDEVGWWCQADAMIQYGKPLGYCGYNGTHAIIGTWGAWGGIPILPYCLFGKIFGWKLYSMALANMTFLSFALFAFLVLVKPNKKQKIWLIITYFFLIIMIGYSMTSMSEGLRYSTGIILTGLLIWLDQRIWKKEKEEKKFLITDILKYILIAVFVYYAVMVYLIFSLVVPLFCWLLFRKIKPLLRIGISFVVTSIVAVSANYFTSLFNAPYMTSTITTIISVMKRDGLYQGCCYILDIFFDNLATVNFPNLLNGDTILFWFFSLYLIILCYLSRRIAYLIRKRNQTELLVDHNYYYFFAFWMMSGFLFGYCMLYTGSNWTLCRGINTGLIMAFLFLIFVKSMDDKKILIIISFLGIVSIWGYYRQVIDGRAFVAQYTDVIITEKEKLREVIDVSEENSTWENTVAHYGVVNYMYLALPTGCGLNYMIDGGVNENAKYALITYEDAGREIYKQILIDSGHSIIYEDEYFVVLLNSKFIESK